MAKFTSTSVVKKQIVASTGLMLILFVVGHLAGNLTFYMGPEAFNGYAEKLSHLRPALYVIEVGLFAIFVVHMWFTCLLVLENIRARSTGYQIRRLSEKRSLATRLMPYSGTAVLAFVIWHLLDFTFVDKAGELSFLSDGKSYGLYGVVLNAFSNPMHSFLYVMAMIAIGLHLSHGIQSFCQTFGFASPATHPYLRKISNGAALFITLLYSSIPLYVLFSIK